MILTVPYLISWDFFIIFYVNQEDYACVLTFLKIEMEIPLYSNMVFHSKGELKHLGKTVNGLSWASWIVGEYTRNSLDRI